MQRFGGVHKGTRNAQALHGRDNLAPYEAAFANAAHNQLASSLTVFGDDFDRLEQAMARDVVRLVQEGDL